jgi:hypothetical protein
MNEIACQLSLLTRVRREFSAGRYASVEQVPPGERPVPSLAAPLAFRLAGLDFT